VETGFKAGGFFATLDNPVYDPETITAYTLGSKNRFFGNRLQLNAEVFYWKYKDQQYSHLKTNSRGGFDFVTENIGQSSYKGVDVDIQFLATENTLLTAAVQYLDAKADDFTFRNPAALGPPNVGCPFTLVPAGGYYLVNCSGKVPPKSPKVTASLGVQQTIPLSSGAQIVLNAHTNYQSRNLAGQDYLPQQYQKAYWITDLQASFVDAEDRYELAAFVNNVSDEAVAGNVNIHPQSPTIFGASLRPPRTYGVRVSAKF
jgi:iron complex outermembrane recepter protein